jgi:hypothetical protein
MIQQPVMTRGRKEYERFLKSNPFSTSLIQSEMYHGNSIKNITKFKSLKEGLWFTQYPEWCRHFYLNDMLDFGQIYICWINVQNPYYPNSEELDEYYNNKDIHKFFTKLKKKGYDSYYQGGESGTIAIFKNVKIIDALTGTKM